jgi:hypothetical protein
MFYPLPDDYSKYFLRYSFYSYCRKYSYFTDRAYGWLLSHGTGVVLALAIFFAGQWLNDVKAAGIKLSGMG